MFGRQFLSHALVDALADPYHDGRKQKHSELVLIFKAIMMRTDLEVWLRICDAANIGSVESPLPRFKLGQEGKTVTWPDRVCNDDGRQGLRRSC